MRIFIALSVLTFAVWGCGGKDFQYTDSNEIKPGPGLLSGEDGVFTLIKKDGVETKEQQKVKSAVTE